MRVYAGVTGADRRAERRERLLSAGLDLLGSVDGPRNFTLRGICRAAELGPRYFYESFDDLEEFAVAIYDEEITALTIVTLDALEGVDRSDDEARIRTSLGALIGHIAQDMRRGRLLYSTALSSVAAVDARRRDSTRLFVGLLVDESNPATKLHSPTDVLSEMLVGGLAQAIKAWLDGDLVLSQAELVDACSQVFLDNLGSRRR
jgi:AcrR family transcriptional regulator